MIIVKTSYSHASYSFSKANSISSLVKCTSTLEKKLHLKLSFEWAPMVQVHRVKKNFVYIMNVTFDCYEECLK
jgi:hypothetical protein